MTALADEIILVTGASQGLGEQVAKAYTAVGATVILVARHQKRLKKVYDTIVAVGSPESFTTCFDLMSVEEKEFEQSAETTDEATGGKLDGVVHYASYFYALLPLNFQTVSERVNQYRINTVAPMGLIRALFPLLKQSEDASVTFVSESHGRKPQAYWDGFGASKAALNHLCKVAADEWERFNNLRTNVLALGAINSPQRIKSHPGESKSERKNCEDVLPQFTRWASRKSRRRAGETVYL